MDSNNNYDCSCWKEYPPKKDENSVNVCSCCVTGLEKMIKKHFRCGDTIGITFFGEKVAAIYIGRFRGLENSVIEVEDLLVPGTTSFVPLCDVDSIERGIAFQEAPMQIGRP
ncbi:hypothetical protein LC065_02350 [Halobacillus litoralis]|uniref:hypothetical protein n=1 Tax=Halobacillus litoralis TaxID=45668 RepID=UPI001CFDC19A|nr:hypothetical protein [Halobacillus litoralis]WLR48134.1 hypothetical protein LC065_02350 [Halobacillus litoralis]